MSARSVALLGGPSAGKSAWIGAMLDHMDREEGPIALDGLAADARAYRAFKEPIERGDYPARTSKQADAELLHLDLPLKTRPPLPTERFRLHLSDYAGEEVERIFEQRAWTAAWEDRARASALLLMIRPAEAERDRPAGERPATEPLPRLVAPPLDPTAPLSPDALFGGIPETPPILPPPADHDPVRVPTALAIVELIQCLRHARGLALGERPPVAAFRVGVLFSAWDAMDPRWQSAGPELYARQELALVADLLRSSFDPLDVRYFGLSSTGGDLRDPKYRARYLDEPEGFVAWSGPFRVEKSPDITLPLAWALHGEAAMRAR